MKKIFEFFEQILPIDVVRKYVLIKLSTYAHGSTKDETFYCFGCFESNKILATNRLYF